MATRMIFSDGTFTWPQYCDDNERLKIQTKLRSGNIRMYCGCRKDILLEYKISSDLRFVPIHIGYEHAAWCDRHDIYKRNSAYICSDTGEIRAYLGFDFKNFSYSKPDENANIGKCSENLATGQQTKQKTSAKKENQPPTMDLEHFIKTLNYDAYTSRIKDNKYAYLSRAYYRNVVIGRTKKIHLNNTYKKLSELDINIDGVSFIYAPISALSDNSITLTYADKKYSYFIPRELLERTKKKFQAAYEISVEDCLYSGAEVIAAGFRYKRRSKNGNEYKVIGRVVLFMTNKYGLYASNMQELNLLDNLMDYCAQTGAVFVLPDNADSDFIGTISYKGCETAIYPSETPDCCEYDKVCALHDMIPSVYELSHILI